jgi:hypothetical protein
MYIFTKDVTIAIYIKDVSELFDKMFELSHPSLIHIQEVSNRTGKSFYIIPNIIGGIDAVDVNRVGMDEDCFPLGVIRPNIDYYKHQKDDSVLKKVFRIYNTNGAGLKNLVDIEGNFIEEGDQLSWNYGEYNIAPSKWMLEPCFTVKSNSIGHLYGISIFGNYHLNDFCFRFCRKITAP